MSHPLPSVCVRQSEMSRIAPVLALTSPLCAFTSLFICTGGVGCSTTFLCHPVPLCQLCAVGIDTLGPSLPTPAPRSARLVSCSPAREALGENAPNTSHAPCSSARESSCSILTQFTPSLVEPLTGPLNAARTQLQSQPAVNTHCLTMAF